MPILRFMAALLLFLCGACSRQTDQSNPAAAEEDLVYSEQFFTWFEEVGGHFRLSPETRLALFEIRGKVRLIDLQSGTDLSERLAADLEAVRDAAFDAAGGLVRRGRRGVEAGWFRGEGESISPLDLPADARPAFSPDGSQLAFIRASTPAGLWAGAEGDYRRYPLPPQTKGRISGIGWSPEGRTLYVMLADDAGISSLFRLDLTDGDFELLAEGLDSEGLDAPILDGRLAIQTGLPTAVGWPLFPGTETTSAPPIAGSFQSTPPPACPSMCFGWPCRSPSAMSPGWLGRRWAVRSLWWKTEAASNAHCGSSISQPIRHPNGSTFKA